MKTTFSFERLGLLLRRFFIENKQKEIIFWAILTLVFVVIHQEESVKMILYISGFIFAARQYKIFSNTPNGMHYLLIPATHTEKLTASILLSTIYFFTATMLAYVIGNIVGTNLINLILDRSTPIEWDLFVAKEWMKNGESPLFMLIKSFLFIQAVFMLGALYFKHNAIGKTWLTFFGLMIILGLFQLMLMKILWFDLELAGKSITSYSIQNQSSLDFLSGRVGEVLSYTITPFLWIVSYFRLTEKQV